MRAPCGVSVWNMFDRNSSETKTDKLAVIPTVSAKVRRFPFAPVAILYKAGAMNAYKTANAKRAGNITYGLGAMRCSKPEKATGIIHNDK